jgi:hypothetical protein
MATGAMPRGAGRFLFAFTVIGLKHLALDLINSLLITAETMQNVSATMQIASPLSDCGNHDLIMAKSHKP